MKLVLSLLVLLGLMASIWASKDPICDQQFAKTEAEDGSECRALMPSYSYDKSINECVSFMYTGCHGNDNRFDYKADCEEKCVE